MNNHHLICSSDFQTRKFPECQVTSRTILCWEEFGKNKRKWEKLERPCNTVNKSFKDPCNIYLIKKETDKLCGICFPCGSAGKESACNAGVQFSCSVMSDSVTPVQFLGQEDPLEKGWAIHSIVLGLPLWLRLVKNLPASGRPGFDPWVGKIPWRRERLPTPVLWPGQFHGLYSTWGCKESDTTERLSLCHKCVGYIWNRKQESEDVKN